MKALNKKGFTLIEVIVVVGIIAILSGIMIPFIYKIWEGNEIELTKERMSDLKKAMIGDPRLIQNGIRTNFGFVGDNGQLPLPVAHSTIAGEFTISDDLVSNSSGLYQYWSGPYTPSGFDPHNYKKDAWGTEIVYSVSTGEGGRRVAAFLRSAGPDRILGTSDDIDEKTDPYLSISESEVTPTDTVQGNLNFVFFNSTSGIVSPSYSANLKVTYRSPSGESTSFSGCVSLNIGQINPNETKTLMQNFSSTFSEKLPVGKALFKSLLYTNNTCSGTAIESTNSVAVFIGDGWNTISINAPTISYTIQ